MFPTIKNGDILFVSRIFFPIKLPFIKETVQIGKPNLQKNEILVFENNKNEILVKRLQGTPFDFYIFDNDKFLVSPDEIPSPKNSKEEKNWKGSIDGNLEFLPIFEKGRIPEGYYLLLGDNRDYSTDSRSFGLVPFSYLRGKVLWIF